MSEPTDPENMLHELDKENEDHVQVLGLRQCVGILSHNVKSCVVETHE